MNITLERPTGGGGSELVEFEGAKKLLNVPQKDKAMVTTADGERVTVPCASVVSAEE